MNILPKVELNITTVLDTAEKIIFALATYGIWFTDYPDSMKMVSTVVLVVLLKLNTYISILRNKKLESRVEMNDAKNKEDPPNKKRRQHNIDADL